MLMKILRGISSQPSEQSQPEAPVPSPQVMPAVLYLEENPGLRVIVPPVDGSYAAVVNSRHGVVIIDRYDAGVGWQLTEHGAYDANQMEFLEFTARAAPPGAVLLDIGANIGIAALTLSRVAGPAGTVHAFEPQRVIFHMLAGNMALNSIDNVFVYHQAVGRAPGQARIPRLDYRAQTSFGSVELNREYQSDANQQALDGVFDNVTMISLDGLALPRVDFIKIDVEGMEAEVLAGAAQTISRCRPLMYIEYLKTGRQAVAGPLIRIAYALFDVGDNFVCVPEEHLRLGEFTDRFTRWTSAGQDIPE